jgi:hypothetical protein
MLLEIDRMLVNFRARVTSLPIDPTSAIRPAVV